MILHTIYLESEKNFRGFCFFVCDGADNGMFGENGAREDGVYLACMFDYAI